MKVCDPSHHENNSRVFRPETSGLPLVIVLNLFHSGLGIARQLHEKGVRLIGLSPNSGAFGNYTRMCDVHSAPSSKDQPRELADFLLRWVPVWRGGVIFPTCDADLLFLDRFRADLAEHYRLAVPSSEVLHRVMNKATLADVALKAGVPAPPSVIVRSADELQRQSELVGGFPCVVKPIISQQWRKDNNWKIVGGRKAFRVNSLSDLEREYRTISQAHPEVLLQQWIPGATNEIVVWGGYLQAGKPPATYFTARKIVESPQEFGTGCVVENQAIPELLEPSVQLASALGYEGIAEIEYKRDPRDGRFKLIEINPRHWDWHELGNASGSNISLTAYCQMIGATPPPRQNPVGRRQWVAEDSLCLHALTCLCDYNVSGFKVGRLISRRHVYSIFRPEDPWPLIRYFSGALFPTIIRKVVRKVSGVVLRRPARTPAKTAAVHKTEIDRLRLNSDWRSQQSEVQH